MDRKAGWWTTSGNIGLPPLARVMGVGRHQQYAISRGNVTDVVYLDFQKGVSWDHCSLCCTYMTYLTHELLSTGLEHVLEEKDLGIIIDSNLTFESHIEAKLGAANQMFGLIRRSFTCCTAEIVIPLYQAFVHQHLEFGVAVWGGFIKRRQLHAIEKVQMRATKIVKSVKDRAI